MSNQIRILRLQITKNKKKNDKELNLQQIALMNLFLVEIMLRKKLLTHLYQMNYKLLILKIIEKKSNKEKSNTMNAMQKQM